MENQNLSQNPKNDPDEINLLEYFYALVHRKWWIIGLTVLGLVLGFIAAKIKGPTWVAEAVIAPKDAESQKGSPLAAFGSLSGIVSSQLNLNGNANLDKIDIILGSRDFNAKMIEKNSFLPLLIKNEWPPKYKKYWNVEKNGWNPDFVFPNYLDMGSVLKGKHLQKTKDIKMNTISIKIASKDSSFTFNLGTMYIEYLNEYIKTNVEKDAKDNVGYLDTQLSRIADPLLREKIQTLISNEIEKQMIVSKEAFHVVDPVYMSKTFKEKKLYPLVFGLGFFFLSCLLIVFFHAFSSADKTEEDKKLLEKIKKELFLAKK